ncbi:MULTISPECIES: hypothetical protein [Inquilinus]|uniref:Anti sigma-E protein RseA N-terminal domain-containing protein n=1 Tax=Inquilinus ginsengisoli TaxID=363840 RepID=A0ABU1JZ01_9PROT|nr:hypothetical protein [Inquilinus ginsengisoli]MDR6293844.1 hypothetical protein [Inquilinus ginsengisoli]
MAEMTLDRFLDLLDRHGPVIDRWPGPDQDGAEALLAQSAPARSAMADARAVATALNDLRVAPPSAALLGRILDAAPRPRRWISEILSWRPAVAFAAALVVGVWLGAMAPTPVQASDDDWSTFGFAMADDVSSLGVSP